MLIFIFLIYLFSKNATSRKEKKTVNRHYSEYRHLVVQSQRVSIRSLSPETFRHSTSIWQQQINLLHKHYASVPGIYKVLVQNDEWFVASTHRSPTTKGPCEWSSIMNLHWQGFMKQVTATHKCQKQLLTSKEITTSYWLKDWKRSHKNPLYCF